MPLLKVITKRRTPAVTDEEIEPTTVRQETTDETQLQNAADLKPKASKSRLKLAARAVLSADAGLLV